MNQDLKYIEHCKSLIENKVSNVITKPYNRRGFQFLSNDIFDNTNILLHAVTLRRLWENGKKNGIPQLKTLDALSIYLGYKDWYDFKSNSIIGDNRDKYILQNVKESKNKSKYLKFKYFSGIIILLVLAIYILGFRKHGSTVRYDDKRIYLEAEDIKFDGVPTSVKFTCKLNGLKCTDFAFDPDNFQKRKEKLNSNNNSLSILYYTPGIHTPKLYYKDKVVKERKLFISTKNWQTYTSIINKHQDFPHYYITDTIVENDGIIFATPEDLAKVGINSNTDTYEVNYVNCRNFGDKSGDSFTIETSIMNSSVGGIMKCQCSIIIILSENGIIRIPFCNSRYTAILYLKLNEKTINGETEDLSFFGCDLSKLQNITIKNENKRVSVIRNEKLLSRFEYVEPMGRIIGIRFLFHGCGKVNYVKLYNNNEVLLSQNFN